MPDSFGFETPEEVLARLRAEARERSNAFAQTPIGQSPGGQLGQSLAAIFGPALRKHLDTRALRKSEAQRFVEATGVSQREARQLAKQNIPAEFAQVRQAKDVQKAGQSSVKLRDELIRNGTSVVDAQVAGMFSMAATLRNLGLNDQATELSLQATQAHNDEQLRLQKVDELNADIAKTRRETELLGQDAHGNRVLRETRLIEQIAALNDVAEDERDFAEIESKERELGRTQAKLLKDENIPETVGRTEQDVRNDPVLQRQLITDFAADSELIGQIDNAFLALDDLSAFEAGIGGRIKAGFIGFLENTLAIRPNESDRDFMNRYVAAKGINSLIAAKIRHALTGAQMSAFEIQYLTPFLPSPGDARSLVEAKLRAVKSYTQQSIETRRAVFASDSIATFMTVAQSAPPINPSDTGAAPSDEATAAVEGVTKDVLNILQ